jgi:hypothetical protein
VAKPKKHRGPRTVPAVTDHAVVRYLERVLGYDVDGIREAILCESVRKAIKAFGTAKIPHPDGFRVVVEDRQVVTIYAAGHGIQER